MQNEDLIGQKFGRLLVLELDKEKTQRERERNGQKTPWFKCECECGSIVTVRKYCLLKGKTKSCGCLKRETMSRIAKTHGMGNTRLYTIWCSMKARVLNPNSTKYKDYGGRGIKVCDRWLHSFENFYEDALHLGHQDGLQIDRIDVNGDYEPNNVRFVTNKENCNNKRSHHLVYYEGEKITLSQLAEKLSISRQTIESRLQLGWSLERAISTPIRGLRQLTFDYQGEKLDSVQLAKRLGVPWPTLYQNIRKFNWTIEQILAWLPNRSKRRNNVATP